MNFLEVVEQAKEIVEAIDAKDEEVIANMKKFAPKSFDIAMKLIEKYEPAIMKIIISGIAIAEEIGGFSSEKLSIAVEKAEGIPDAPSIISQTVNFINSFIKER